MMRDAFTNLPDPVQCDADPIRVAQRHPRAGQQRLFPPYPEPYSRPMPTDDPQMVRVTV